MSNDGVPWRSANATFTSVGFSMVLRDIETLMLRNTAAGEVQATLDSAGISTGDTATSASSGSTSGVLDITSGTISFTRLTSPVTLPSTAKRLVLIACGGGGGGGLGHAPATRYVASSSGGSPTTAITEEGRLFMGTSGAPGSSCFAIVDVAALVAGGATSLSASVGGGGAAATVADTSGVAGGSTTVSLGANTLLTAPGGAGGLSSANTSVNSGGLPSSAFASIFLTWRGTTGEHGGATTGKSPQAFMPSAYAGGGIGGNGGAPSTYTASAGAAGEVWYAIV